LYIHVTPILKCIGPRGLFRSFRSIFLYYISILKYPLPNFSECNFNVLKKVTCTPRVCRDVEPLVSTTSSVHTHILHTYYMQIGRSMKKELFNYKTGTTDDYYKTDYVAR